MQKSFLGFSTNKMVELNLDIVDIVLLRYFVDYKDSGCMVMRVVGDVNHYYLDYIQVVEALAYLKLKKDSLYRRLKKLVKANVLVHTILFEIDGFKGTFSFYGLGSNYSKLLNDRD